MLESLVQCLITVDQRLRAGVQSSITDDQHPNTDDQRPMALYQRLIIDDQ